jgi:hypothetical protein
MAITNPSGLTLTAYTTGIPYSKVIDNSNEWTGVSNSTYFFDKSDGLVHYKDGSGIVLEIFAAGGSTTIPQTDILYIDSVNGSDNGDSGRGNIDKPYASVEYALSSTTNTGVVTGSTANGSATITGVTDTTSIKVGQYITGTNIPYNSVVVSKTANTIVLSRTASGSGTGLTLTWWTPKTIKINGNIVATSNWFKPCFWFDASNSNVTFGNFSLFSKSAACLVPEIVVLGNVYGNNASSQFMTTTAGSAHDIYIVLKNYFSIGTGAQFNLNQFSAGFRNFYLNCETFDCRFGIVGFLVGSVLTQLNGYFYGLLGGITFSQAVAGSNVVVNGTIETPASINAYVCAVGYHQINANIIGSFDCSSGNVASMNVNGSIVGTTVNLGASSQFRQGCNINGNIECTNLSVTSSNYNTQINGRVKGNITHNGGQLNIQKFYGGTYTGTGSTTTAFITGFINSVTNDRYGNLTLSSGAKLYWTSSGNDYSVTAGFIFASISVASTCTLFVQGKLMGEIASLAGTIQVDSNGYLWIIKRTSAITGSLLNYGGVIELTRNGFGNTTESATSTPTIDISTGTYQQDGGTLFCSNADSRSGLIRKTASGGKVILRGQAYLKVANGLAPLQILSNTGTAQDILDFSMVGNGALGFRLADTFSDTTYGTAYAPNLLVSGVHYQDTTYSF